MLPTQPINSPQSIRNPVTPLHQLARSPLPANESNLKFVNDPEKKPQHHARRTRLLYTLPPSPPKTFRALLRCARPLKGISSAALARL